MTKEELNKIYNYAVETLESVDTMYWTLGEAKKYVQGYIEALVNNNFITAKDGLSLSFELNQAINEIHEKEN